MKIEHAAVYVYDIEKTKDFFVRYLGGRSNEMYRNAEGFCSYFISFDDGARLEIMNKPGISDEADKENRTGYSHIAFSVGSREKVDELTARMSADGYKILSGPRVTGDGYYESCVIATEGILVELTV